MSKILYQLKRDSLIKIADELPKNMPHYSIILEAVSDCLEEMKKCRQEQGGDRQGVKLVVIFSLIFIFFVGLNMGYNIGYNRALEEIENVR